jgi:hypothetical protein
MPDGPPGARPGRTRFTLQPGVRNELPLTFNALAISGATYQTYRVFLEATVEGGGLSYQGLNLAQLTVRPP